ncbi:AAA family ATPase [Deltaproteobacteria bacterium]|nr:AAA family ATPase [Deltaproteobacteria bacterium]
MPDYFSGRVHTVVYRNPPFYILKVLLDEEEADEDASSFFSSNSRKMVTARGNIPGLSIAEGAWFGFNGKWETHEKFGKQIKITRAPVLKGGWTTDKVEKLLVAQGVGEMVMARVAKHFGKSLADELDKGDPEVLLAVRGMTPLNGEFILTKWKMVKAYFGTLEFLAESGVPSNRIAQVWGRFEEKAQDILTANPWALVQIDGISFAQADEVAMKLGLDLGHPKRTEGAVLFACKSKKGMGHLYLGSGEMLSEVQANIPDAGAREVADALKALHKAGEITVDRQTRPGTTAIYEPWLLRLETDCAKLLVDRLKTAHITDPKYPAALGKVGAASEEAAKAGEDMMVVAKAALEDWSLGSQITLSEHQLLGVLNALTQPVSILSGLPGTGKTTSLRAAVQVLLDAGVGLLLCAPTGIAAKRIQSVTGAEASTIHRAFQAKGWDVGGERAASYVGITGDSSSEAGSDGSAEEWGYTHDQPHPADVVIIDESSMVDQHLLYRVLSCTKPTARIVFVGDAAQLPSVGPGNVLRDIIEAAVFPTVNLTEIYRQEDTSDIVLAAHATYKGEIPQTGSGKNSDFVLIQAKSEEAVLDIVVKLGSKLYDKRAQFQVMSPRHAGTLGVTNLNARLRELLNPKSPGLSEMRLGSEVVREGDRVMVVKNNYKLGIFNGDMGKVAQLDRSAKEVVIKVHGSPPQYIRVKFKDAPRYIRLAYTVTVHKMQGQESDIIIMPLVKSFGYQLQRNLFYTAITRAKKRVILVGHHEAIVMSVRNNRPNARNTLFLDRLQAAYGDGGSETDSGA